MRGRCSDAMPCPVSRTSMRAQAPSLQVRTRQVPPAVHGVARIEEQVQENLLSFPALP